MKFIGIDLAWTYKNETGLCIIDDEGAVEYFESAVYSDDDIVEIIKRHCGDDKMYIGIDAPLIVNNEKGSRAAERAFMRYKIHGHHLSLFVASRGFLLRNFGVIRGEVLMNKIMDAIPSVKSSSTFDNEHSVIVETFPSGICLGLFPELHPVKYKVKNKIPYEETKHQMMRLLERIRPLGVEVEAFDKKNHKHIEDKVDAFLCAYGLYSVYTDRAEIKVFGSEEDGFFVIPIKKCKNTNNCKIS